MELAFSTNAYTRFTLSQALAGIARAGFHAVEILADAPHAYPDTLSEESINEIRRDLDRHGLRVSNVNANCSFGYWRHAPPEPYFEPSLISPDASHRADRLRMVLRTLEFAAEVGAANISITSGRMLGPVGPERAAELLRDGLAPILQRADELGVDVGIELEPGLYLEYVPELVDLIAKVGSPRLGANLDIGHSVVMGESVAEAVRSLSGRTWNLHIEDLPGRKHYHMIPGRGTFPWAELRQSLLATGYDRYLTVELYTHWFDPQAAAEESFRWLHKWLHTSAGG